MDVAQFLFLFKGEAGPALASIGRLDAALGELDAKGKGRMSAIGGAATAVAGSLAAAALGVSAWAVQGAANLDAALTRIHTQAGATEEDLGKIKKSIYELAPQVGQGPDALAAALYHIESAGYRGQQAMDMMTQSARLASVGNSDLVDTTKMVIFTIQSGIPGVHGAADAVAQLNAIVGNGDMTMQQLAASMSSGIFGAAATFGVSLQSVGAAMAFMADRGTAPQEAATKLRMSISLLGAPSRLAQKILGDLGLSQTEAADRSNAMADALKLAGVSTTAMADDLRKPNGFMVALQDLKQHMNDAGISAELQAATLSRAFGGGRSGAAIMQMYSALDGLKQKFGLVTEGTKKWDGAWEETKKTFVFQEHAMSASIQVLRNKLGDALMPTAIQVMQLFNGPVKDALSRAADWFGHFLPDAIHKVNDWFATHREGIMSVVDTIKDVAIVAFKEIVIIFAVIWTAISHLIDIWSKFRNILEPLILTFVTLKIAMFVEDKIIGSYKALLGAWKDIEKFIKGIGIAEAWAVEHAKMLVSSISFHVQYALLWVQEKAKWLADLAEKAAAWAAHYVVLLAEAVAKIELIVAKWVWEAAQFIAQTVIKGAAYVAHLAWAVWLTGIQVGIIVAKWAWERARFLIELAAKGLAYLLALGAMETETAASVLVMQTSLGELLGTLGAVAVAAAGITFGLSKLAQGWGGAGGNLLMPGPHFRDDTLKWVGDHMPWHRAGGGDIQAGEWSIVGEHGPELRQFGRSGRIISKEDSAALFGAQNGPGGSSGDTYHIYNPVSQADVTNGIAVGKYLSRVGQRFTPSPVLPLHLQQESA